MKDAKVALYLLEAAEATLDQAKRAIRNGAAAQALEVRMDGDGGYGTKYDAPARVFRQIKASQDNAASALEAARDITYQAKSACSGWTTDIREVPDPEPVAAFEIPLTDEQEADLSDPRD